MDHQFIDPSWFCSTAKFDKFPSTADFDTDAGEMRYTARFDGQLMANDGGTVQAIIEAKAKRRASVLNVSTTFKTSSQRRKHPTSNSIPG